MKSQKEDVPASIRDSVIIVRCRDIELSAMDRSELHRSEIAMAHVFQQIHRVEWKIVARGRGVEVRCAIRARSGEFSAHAEESDARSAFQAVTGKILKQKRRAKVIATTRRRSA